TASRAILHLRPHRRRIILGLAALGGQRSLGKLWIAVDDGRLDAVDQNLHLGTLERPLRIQKRYREGKLARLLRQPLRAATHRNDQKNDDADGNRFRHGVPLSFPRTRTIRNPTPPASSAAIWLLGKAFRAALNLDPIIEADLVARQAA